MSSDDYFGDSEQLNSAFLAELDALEATHLNATQPPSQANPTQPTIAPSISFKSTLQTSPIALSKVPGASMNVPQASSSKDAIPSKPQPISIDVDADESYDRFFDDIDPIELDKLEKDVENAFSDNPSIARTNTAPGSGVTHQLTLFGDLLPPTPSRVLRASQQKSQAKGPHSPRKPFGKKARKVKRWDHTAFAKSGGKSSKEKAKSRGKATDFDEEADEAMHSTEEFEQFPALKLPSGPPPSFKHVPDLLSAHTWIYPTNKPKRDYQFNIVRDSLFENTLVSLPTGLGKTFIAGVLMLNYYRWFPDGKVVFVAPTKPLVAQQIDACHKICGIPGGDAAELTGQNPRSIRAKAWAEKRVFFMTPQTFLNDLRTENCDPTDVVLLVIDEAHKATGNYAYAQIVRWLMAKSAHFRVLALTATPGSKPEAVQDIINSLHISNVEIRDENSIDLRKYMLPKKISTHVVRMTAGVVTVRDMLAKLMEKIAKRLCDTGLIPNLNVVTLHSYRCSALMQQFSGDGTGKKFPWVYNDLKKLGALARAMGYLLECSVAMCHEELHGMTTDAGQDGKRSSGLRSEPLFQNLVTELERQHNTGFFLHPKLDKLQSLAVDYFVQSKMDTDLARDATSASATDEVGAPGYQTKMMIFTNFRASVDEIVELLNTHHPLIRATRFIGQGSDKHGRKGIAQKDQLEVIKKFKEGVYNVLVATSIGEEGLDIGEVDMIICYDAQKTPIRMLQRVGRTGRKRAGRVEVLLSEAREEANWDKAKEHYESVQSSILRGESLELFADVGRLLPDHIKPKCVETTMAIEEYVRDTKPSKLNSAAAKGTKRKRNADVMRNIPDGAVNGFVPSSKLISTRDPKKRKVVDAKCSEDEDDRAIQASIGDSPCKGRAKGKAKPRKNTGKIKHRSRQTTSELSLSQLDRELADDTDDMEIELGIKLLSPKRPLADIEPSKGPFRRSSSPGSIYLSPEPNFNLAKANEGVALRNNSSQVHYAENQSYLLDSDDDEVLVLDDIGPSVNVQNSKLEHSSPITPPELSSFRRSPLSHASLERHGQNGMFPPPVPARALTTEPLPDSTFVPCLPGVRRKRPRISSSPALDHRSEIDNATSSPPQVHVRRRRGPVDSRAAMELLDLEAQVSGDGSTAGSSDHEDIESESDRRFVAELPPTQMSPTYDQTLAYRHSLFTQPPSHGNGPQFTSKPARRGVFGPERRTARIISSSPPQDPATDQYSMDSFLVEDDDDVLLHEDSHSSSI